MTSHPHLLRCEGRAAQEAGERAMWGTPLSPTSKSPLILPSPRRDAVSAAAGGRQVGATLAMALHDDDEMNLNAYNVLELVDNELLAAIVDELDPQCLASSNDEPLPVIDTYEKLITVTRAQGGFVMDQCHCQDRIKSKLCSCKEKVVTAWVRFIISTLYSTDKRCIAGVRQIFALFDPNEGGNAAAAGGQHTTITTLAQKMRAYNEKHHGALVRIQLPDEDNKKIRTILPIWDPTPNSPTPTRPGSSASASGASSSSASPGPGGESGESAPPPQASPEDRAAKIARRTPPPQEVSPGEYMYDEYAKRVLDSLPPELTPDQKIAAFERLIALATERCVSERASLLKDSDAEEDEDNQNNMQVRSLGASPREDTEKPMYRSLSPLSVDPPPPSPTAARPHNGLCQRKLDALTAFKASIEKLLEATRFTA